MLIINKMQGRLKVCAVKAPGFGDNKVAYMHGRAPIATGDRWTRGGGSPPLNRPKGDAFPPSNRDELFSCTAGPDMQDVWDL